MTGNFFRFYAKFLAYPYRYELIRSLRSLNTDKIGYTFSYLLKFPDIILGNANVQGI